MSNLLSTSRLTTVVLTLAVLAAAMRVESVKKTVLNEGGWFG